MEGYLDAFIAFIRAERGLSGKTVEFGLVHEDGRIKVYGSGVKTLVSMPG